MTDRKLQNPRLLHIKFTTIRHWKATKEDHRTKNSPYVQRLLGHKNIQNALIYIDLETNLFNSSDDSFTVRVAHNVGEAASLVEVGFEYVCEKEELLFFRKRKRVLVNKLKSSLRVI